MPSHNNEDTRILELLGEPASGFYLDIGANEPEVSSNTYTLYARGWSGILVEPIPDICQRLRRYRPRDIVIEAAAGRECGSQQFFVCEKNELSTGLISIKERHALAFVTLQVPVLTIDEILRMNFPANTTLDVVSLDVEGAEADVLAGFTLPLWRPRLLVIESYLPDSTESNYREWEPNVLRDGYVCRYDDGCNRFYGLQ